MELIGTLQVMTGDDITHDERHVFLVVANHEIKDIRLETKKGGEIFMFRFQPSDLLAALAESLMDPEE
jgi:hypothetical protein